MSERKPTVVIQSPCATRSGYGAHSRDLITALIKADKYEIGLISLPWGTTPQTALDPDNPDHVEILKRVIPMELQFQPDIFIQISVANEFQPRGKYNIGITAGAETNMVPIEFVHGANKMDKVIVPSEFTKQGFAAVYDEVDNSTKKVLGQHKVDTPVDVLFEGVDLNIYRKVGNNIETTIADELGNLESDFNFLFVGHWLKGDLGQDRKDIGMLIQTFCETFKRKARRNQPGLILKTSGAGFSIKDRHAIVNKIRSVTDKYGIKCPPIYLLHGDLSDDEMNSLYNHTKVKAMVSFTKGEGFGRPLLEFGTSGKPIIAPNASGPVDFLHPEYTILLPGDMTEIHPSAADQFLKKGTQWSTVNYGYASKVLNDVFENYKTYLEKSKKQAKHVQTNFSLEKMSELFVEMVDAAVDNVPTLNEIKMPQQIKLPKLKTID